MSYVQFNKDVIGYKKVINEGEEYIVTLLIPKHTTIHSAMLGEVGGLKSIGNCYVYTDKARTVIEERAKLCGEHNTSRSPEFSLRTMDGMSYHRYKCRAECAEVLEIKNMRTGRTVDEICNPASSESYIREILYEVGEMAYPHEFVTYQDDGGRPPICYGGIHFFPERWMAEEYSM